MKRLILILAIVLAALFSNAQSIQLELDLGYGKTSSDESYNSKFVNPFNKYSPNFYKTGLLLYYTPDKSLICFRSGVSYCQRGDVENSTKHIRIPVGMDIKFGNRLFFIIGGGLAGSFLIGYTGPKSNDFKESKKNFQFVGELKAGFGYRINESYELALGIQNDFDITKQYEEKISSPGGAKSTIDKKANDGFLYIAIKYNIVSKK